MFWKQFFISVPFLLLILLDTKPRVKFLSAACGISLGSELAPQDDSDEDDDGDDTSNMCVKRGG